MECELQTVTPEGARMVELAEEHAADFATRADLHDRENSYVGENVEAMKQSGFLAACAPKEFGGLGVESVHDMMVAISRIGRGCPSTAISANMHISSVWVVARWWRLAVRDGDAAREAMFGGFLPRLGASEVVLAGAGTEPGSYAFVPFTEATPVEGGYVLNGRKAFATNSEMADAITVFVRVDGPDGRYHHGMAIVRRDSPGMEIKRNWDALGMRGSGSHDLLFTDCFVPTEMITVEDVFAVPPPEAWMNVIIPNGLPLCSTYLGIAEAAREHIIDVARTKQRKPFTMTFAEKYPVQFDMAEIDVAITASRAALERTGRMVDEFLAAAQGPLDPHATNILVREFATTKLIVERGSADVVDRALRISGGNGYRTGSPLARMYRDVRAGPFMQPMSTYESCQFIGRVSLGIDPYDELRAARDMITPERERAAKAAAAAELEIQRQGEPQPVG